MSLGHEGPKSSRWGKGLVWVEPCGLGRLDLSGRFRRILPVPVRPDEGHLTEPKTAVQPSRREPLYAPNPTLTVAGSKRRGSGGFAPFTAASRIGTTVVLGQPSDRPPVARPALIGYFVPLGFSSG